MADEARINAVVSDIVDGVRAALFKHDVTFDEYRVALAFLLDAFEKNDVPLLMDVFFNTTIVKIEGKLMGGSKPSLEGPYYLENAAVVTRSEEHTSELQSLMRISYAVFCLKKKNNIRYHHHTTKT